VPILAVLVGAVFLALLYRERLRRRGPSPTRPTAEAVSSGADLPDEYVARLEKELEKFKE